ncbi:MAG: hypothetical protein WKF84_27055 [Pyrinomonadaceae bacterium]
MANGFLLAVGMTRQRQMQVLQVAGGWNNVLDRFKSNHVDEMYNNPNRFMVLLIDFDDDENRLKDAKAVIPEHLVDRVFVLSASSEPEDLKKASLGSYETIGLKLAKDCLEEIDTTWGHDLLRHNASELDRLRGHVRSILF